MVNIGNSWDEILKEDFASENYLSLRKFLAEQYRTATVFPPADDLFNALKLTDFNDVKVVILGQDPYHNFGQAHGLAFSVKRGVDAPPSLVNIFKEIESSTNAKCKSACLDSWAKQGVLLLNTSLSVRKNEPMSHRGKGWEVLTDSIVKKLSQREKPVVFLLWGGPARAKKVFVDQSKQFVLEAPHPSPLSAYRGFLGSGHFAKTNEILQKLGEKPIDWSTN